MLSEGSLDIIVLIFKYFICCCGIHMVCAALSAQLGAAVYNDLKKTRAEKMVWNYTCASAVYCFVITYCYMSTTLQFYESVEGRWTGSSKLSVHGISLHLGASLYECLCYVMSGKDTVFYFHHIITILCCGSMLFMGRAQVTTGLITLSILPYIHVHTVVITRII
jgi:hypothetical protein